MNSRFLISIGAGIAAAIFFIVPLKGAMSAGLTMLFAPLPLMIVATTFAPAAAVIGALCGAVLIAFAVHLYYAIFFLGFAGLPAWWLARQAFLVRPAEAGDTDADDGRLWYPIGRLGLWAALLGAAVAAALVIVGSVHFGGYSEFINQLSLGLRTMLEGTLKNRARTPLPANVPVAELARYVTLAMPPILAGWAALAYCLNIWIAGRIARTAQENTRPWHDIPERFRLPPEAAGLAIAAAAAGVIDGFPRMIGMIVLSALATVFAIQGFAILHAATRNNSGRAMLLGLLYAITFMFFPAPAVLAAVFGLGYGLSQLGRNRLQPPSNPNT